MDIGPVSRQPESTRTVNSYYVTKEEVLAVLGISIPAGASTAWSLQGGNQMYISVEYTE